MTPFVGIAFLAGSLLALLALVACAAWRDRVVARQARQAARESSRSLRFVVALVEGSPDAIVAKDLHGCYVFANRAAGRLLGREPAELLGRDDHAVMSAPQAEAQLAQDRLLMAHGQEIEAQEHLQTAEGPVHCRVTRGALRDGAERLIGVYAVWREITLDSTVAPALPRAVRSSRSLHVH
jgi:PAS domain S-box-containing protein